MAVDGEGEGAADGMLDADGGDDGEAALGAGLEPQAATAMARNAKATEERNRTDKVSRLVAATPRLPRQTPRTGARFPAATLVKE